MHTNASFTRQHLADFERDGYVIIPQFFSSGKLTFFPKMKFKEEIP